MSYQQVNLYQPIFRKQQKIFSALTMVQAVAGIAVGLALFFAFARWQSHHIDQQYAQLEARRVEAMSRMEQLRVKFPERAKDLQLEAQVTNLRKELQSRQQIAVRLGQTDAGNIYGFADYLEGLARRKPANVWLTDVSVSRGGADLVLRGSSLQEKSIAHYLQQLAQEPVFAGREFGGLSIEEQEKSPGRFDFVVSPKPLDEKQEKRP